MVTWKIVLGFIFLILSAGSNIIADNVDFQIILMGVDYTAAAFAAVFSVLAGSFILKGVIGGRR